MKLLQCITGGYTSSARVVGDALVLSLPDACSPVVWRMELGDIKAAAFEIKNDGETWTLTMKTPKGEAQSIAPFDSKAKAVRALMTTSRAMEQASTRPVYANDPGHPAAQAARKGKGQLAAGIIGVVLLGVLIVGLVQAGPKPPTSLNATGASSTEATADGASGGAPGVPVSADSFLMNR